MKNYYRNNATSEVVEVDKLKDNADMQGVFSIELYNAKTHELEAECRSENIIFKKQFEDTILFSKMYDNFSRKAIDVGGDNPGSNADYDAIEYPFFPYCLILSDYDGEENESITEFRGTSIASANRTNTSGGGTDYGYLDTKNSYVGWGEIQLSFVFPEVSANNKEFKSIFTSQINSTAQYFRKLMTLNYDYSSTYNNGVCIISNNNLTNCILSFYNPLGEKILADKNLGNITQTLGFDSSRILSPDIFGVKLDDSRIAIVAASTGYTKTLQFAIVDSNYQKIKISEVLTMPDNYLHYYTSRTGGLYFDATTNVLKFTTHGDSNRNNPQLVKINVDTMTLVEVKTLTWATSYGRYGIKHYLADTTHTNRIYDMKIENFVTKTENFVTYYENTNSLFNNPMKQIIDLGDNMYYYASGIYSKIQPFSYTKLPNPIMKNSEQYMKITYKASVSTNLRKTFEGGI